MCRAAGIVIVLCLGLFLVGCRPVLQQPVAEFTTPESAFDASESPKVTGEPADNAAWTTRLNAERVENDNELSTSLNAALPPAEFRSGHADPLDFDKQQISKTERGFVIQLPRKSPVPTPTIYRGKLYVSGGFSTEEYYCFDAATGQFVWGAKLDDDGPSSAVPHDDSIIFGSESCTIFALAADTGQMRWSHWLGDPLLSTPTVAGGRVFTVYPADALGSVDPLGSTEKESDSAIDNPAPVAGSHIAACFDARTGELQWRQWIDSDCMSAPVAAGDNVYFTSLSGTVFAFAQSDGEARCVQRLRATSVPVISGDTMIVTRRADQGEEIAECIAVQELATGHAQFIAARQRAPYLDASIQREAEYSRGAVEFESVNGIGGGFGGGFGFGGQQSVPDEIEGKHVGGAGESAPQPVEQQGLDEAPEDFDSDPSSGDPLVVTQSQAIHNLGLGNVSTLQGFHGSRVLLWSQHMFSSMGDKLVAVSIETEKTLWRKEFAGDVEKTGGHLATSPIAAGKYLLVATVAGEIQQIDPANGEIVRRYEVDGELRFPPVVDSGRIYVTTQDGRIICIATGDTSLTGWPMWGRDPARSNTLR